MKINDKGIAIIKHFESCKLRPYLDAIGLPTIGWGTTVYDNGAKVSLRDAAITQKRADELLEKDLVKFSEQVKKLLKVELTDDQFSALVVFTYNVGGGNLEDSTLLKKINKNPKDETIGGEFGRWNKAKVNGKLTPLLGLTRRRLSERKLYMEGEVHFYEEIK